ncbi:unnamed protein product [Pieris macdunnoughi]|uniref:Uncharacterized protein n=1 Tax=Pieris macdunnoughi TaxID=345717 RepID=A0A821SW56_9NEOP|nr:unnamed protein product [Pieris macdunnoughi]
MNDFGIQKFSTICILSGVFASSDPVVPMQWYQVDKSKLSPDLQEKFVQLHPDKETQEFLSTSIDKSSWVWTQLWYILAKSFLRHFWTTTDING